MVPKKTLVIIGILFVLASIAIVIGALTTGFGNDPSGAEAPAVWGNYSGTMVINCTGATVMSNGTSGDLSEGNFTIWYNQTSLGTAVNDTFFVAQANTSANESYFNVSILGLADGIYNFTCVAMNQSEDGTQWSEIIGGAFNVTIDNTAPTINMTATPAMYGNYTGVIRINFTISDTIKINKSIGVLTITNTTATTNTSAVNLSYPLVQEAGTNQSSRWANKTDINTSKFADGKYNISITAGDTSGNLNTTVFPVTFDNTAPSVTLTAREATQSSLTINLVVSDIASGVQLCTSSRTTATVYGTTVVETGLSCGTSYTYTITCTDHVNLNGTGSITTSTSACTGSSGTGSSSTTYGKTYSITEAQLTAGATKQVAMNEKVKFSVGTTSHTLVVNTVESDKVTVTITSSPQQATLSVGNTRKFELDGDNFYDVSVTLSSITGTKANLVFNSIHEEKTAATEAEQQGQEETTTGETTEEETTGSSLLWLWIILGVVVIVVVVILVMKQKKNKK